MLGKFFKDLFLKKACPLEICRFYFHKNLLFCIKYVLKIATCPGLCVLWLLYEPRKLLLLAYCLIFLSTILQRLKPGVLPHQDPRTYLVEHTGKMSLGLFMPSVHSTAELLPVFLFQIYIWPVITQVINYCLETQQQPTDFCHGMFTSNKAEVFLVSSCSVGCPSQRQLLKSLVQCSGLWTAHYFSST